MAVDIICVETVRRLHDAGVADAVIDASRVLPLTAVAVSMLEIERDLPPFPQEPTNLWSMPLDEVSSRMWQAPIPVAEEEENEKGRSDMEEVFCEAALCQEYACSTHCKSVPSECCLIFQCLRMRLILEDNNPP